MNCEIHQFMVENMYIICWKNITVVIFNIGLGSALHANIKLHLPVLYTVQCYTDCSMDPYVSIKNCKSYKSVKSYEHVYFCRHKLANMFLYCYNTLPLNLI